MVAEFRPAVFVREAGGLAVVVFVVRRAVLLILDFPFKEIIQPLFTFIDDLTPLAKLPQHSDNIGPAVLDIIRIDREWAAFQLNEKAFCIRRVLDMAKLKLPLQYALQLIQRNVTGRHIFTNIKF